MTELSFLLVLLVGGVIGWLIRNWFFQRDLAQDIVGRRLGQRNIPVHPL